MGWWPLGQGNDVIGDEPADEVGDWLTEVGRRRASAGRPLPTVEEVVAVAARALDVVCREVCEDDAETPARLRVVFRNGSEAEVTPGGDKVSASSFEAVLDRIAKVYEQDLGRKPRVRELIGTLAFVLGYPPPGTIARHSGAVRDIAAG